MDNTNKRMCKLIPYLLIIILGGSSSLKNLKITIPARVRVGDSALLTCSYDLEDAHLYAIKWYLDESEFYRFVPRNKPPHYTFHVRNIQVNVSNSNMQDVTLVNMQTNHTGRYKCEVTEDIPRYDTKLQEADVLVVDVPETEPRIVVDRHHLPAGEKLRANCTSGASRPAVNITWTLNGTPLNNTTMNFVTHTRSISNKLSDKKWTNSTLSLNTTGMFQDGRIRIRCFAEITSIYKASASIEITEDHPYLASITGDASPHSGKSNGCSYFILTAFWSHESAVLMINMLLDLLLGVVATR